MPGGVAAGRLFHTFAIVGVDFGERLGNPKTSSSSSIFRVRYLYPKNDNTIRLSRQICEFGFPENKETLFQTGTDLSDSHFYTFQLTNEEGSCLYGHCLRTLPIGPQRHHDAGFRHPEVLCFLTRTPHQLFFEALLTIAAYCRFVQSSDAMFSCTRAGRPLEYAIL